MLTPQQFARTEELFHELVDQSEATQRERLTELRAEAPEIARELELLLFAQTPELPQGFSPRMGSWEAGDGGLAEGDLIGPYRLVRKIGEGGMGVVWEAHQELPVERRVALKLVRWGWDSRTVLVRFLAERQALARMQHPGIATVYDAGSTPDSRPWFAMELIDGLPLTEFCDAHQLSTTRRLELFISVCRAVQHAHRQGLVHRDLKPSNILVTLSDAGPRPKVIDFGVAKATARTLAETHRFTQLGDFVGTPEYMSPEQAGSGDGAIDTRTDVYSLGVLLYELLVGQLPLSAEALRSAALDEIRRAVRESDAEKPSSRVQSADAAVAQRRDTKPETLARSLRGDLDWITLKALQKEPDARYESPAALADDLARHLGGDPVLAGPPSLSYRLRKLSRKHRGGFAAALLITLSLVVGSVLAVAGLVQARRAEGEARAAQARSAADARSNQEVTDFLSELLGSADPYESEVGELTALDLLARGIERVDDLEGEPLVQAQVLRTLGQVYVNLGELDQGRDLLDRALAIYESLDLLETYDASNVHERLGMLRTRRGDLEQAAVDHGRALEIRERVLDPGDSAIGKAQNNLALVLSRLKRHDEAQELFALSLASAKANDAAPMDVATIRANVAVDLTLSRRYEEAIESFRRVLETFQRELGAQHPKVGVIHNNLAYALRFLGRHSEAVEQQQLALEVEEASLGPEHPAIGLTLVNLSRSHTARGDWTLAVAALDRAYDVLVAAHGEQNLYVALALSARSTAELGAGDLDAAETSIREALQITRSGTDPAREQRLLWRTAHLARIHRLRGDFDMAERHCEEILAEIEEHPSRVHCELQLAWLAERAGDEERSRSLYESATQGLAESELTAVDHTDAPMTRAAYWLEAGDRERASRFLRIGIEGGRGGAWVLGNPDLGDLALAPENREVMERLWQELGVDPPPDR